MFDLLFISPFEKLLKTEKQGKMMAVEFLRLSSGVCQTGGSRLGTHETSELLPITVGFLI